jgi:hypothetical protein
MSPALPRGQEQHHVALVVRALELQVDRIELEAEVITEGAIEPDRGIFCGMEEVGNGAQDRKHGRHPRALFLGIDPARLVDGQVQPTRRTGTKRDLFDACQMLADDLEQHFAALVIGIEPHRPAERRNAERRIGHRHVPTRIAARIFIVRREDGAAPLVESIYIAVDSAGIGRCYAGPRDRDTAFGIAYFHIAFNSVHHEFPCCIWRCGLRRSNKKAARKTRRGPVPFSQTCKRL